MQKKNILRWANFLTGFFYFLFPMIILFSIIDIPQIIGEKVFHIHWRHSILLTGMEFYIYLVFSYIPGWVINSYSVKIKLKMIDRVVNIINIYKQNKEEIDYAYLIIGKWKRVDDKSIESTWRFGSLGGLTITSNEKKKYRYEIDFNNLKINGMFESFQIIHITENEMTLKSNTSSKELHFMM